MAALYATPTDRIRGATGAALLVGIVIWGLVAGLAIRPAPMIRDALTLFQVTPDKPERAAPVPEQKRSGKPEGAAAPPGLRAKPTDVVAPPLPAQTPPPLAAAPVAGQGSASLLGAAPVAGPGTGAGGQGNGTGSGGSGNGEGSGGGSPPRWIKGGPKDSDYPNDLDYGGTVTVRYIVGVDGRVASCGILVSSGNAELDAITCNAIVKRTRYKPARDRNGVAVSAAIVENQTWGRDSRPDGEPERE